ncbi:MAG TPA: family 1 glycosylhydrolase [Terriglobales bacterium]|nr:family 1 glycosylhydrolase [Terriglobales bacterium]
MSHFPDHFLWGVATSAHQVEGGNENNQWFEWERAGGIKSGDSCGQACDWWTNAERDFNLAQQIGVNALRLSIEWSRVEPVPGRFDQSALDRYRRMLEDLRRRAIIPIISLHHFTNPLWFENEGAFLQAHAVQHFTRYCSRIIEEFGDLCSHWVTFNEPNVLAALSYVVGEFPPGKRGQIVPAVRLIYGMARAHAAAYATIHRLQPQAQVGWAHHYVAFDPASIHSLSDRWTTRVVDYLFNESFLRLVETGHGGFPFDLLFGDAADVSGTCDFVGLNVYSRFHVAFAPSLISQLCARIFVPEHVPQGDRGVHQPYGEAYPAAIRAAVTRVARLNKPIYILENGVPDARDRIRPWLIVNAVNEIRQLVEQGHDIRGYFHWTLTDNFEWSEGWHLRFGLIGLDPKTQERILRPSAYIYGEIARSNRLSPEMIAQYGGEALATNSSL